MNSEYELLDVYCIPSKTNVYFRNGVTNKLLEVIEVSLIEKDEYNGLKDIIYPLNITD